MHRACFSLLIVALFIPLLAHAHDLFHPVPREERREFDSDRPGFTDSPHTTDAGHVQLESGLFAYTLTRAPGQETESYALNSLSVGVGLLDFLELQAAFDSYDWQAVHQVGAPTSKASGFGDLTFRTKFGVLGNNGGKLVIGVIPKVKIPSGAVGNHKAEEGVNVPLSFELFEDYSLGLMPEWDHRLNADGSAYHEEFLAALILTGKIRGPLAGYVQYQTITSTEGGVSRSDSAGFGLLYKLNSDMQLDAGLNLGLTAIAPDRNAQFGIVARY
jgi:hypothetical protein